MTLPTLIKIYHVTMHTLGVHYVCSQTISVHSKHGAAVLPVCFLSETLPGLRLLSAHGVCCEEEPRRSPAGACAGAHAESTSEAPSRTRLLAVARSLHGTEPRLCASSRHSCNRGHFFTGHGREAHGLAMRKRCAMGPARGGRSR